MEGRQSIQGDDGLSKGSTGRKKSGSVLARQKPKKARKKARSSYFKRPFWALCILCVPLLAWGGFWSVNQASSWFSAWLNKPVGWQLTLNIAGEKPLPQEQAREILEIANRELQAGTRGDMLRAAREIQQFSSFANVHFVKLSSHEMVLHVSRREPLLCVEADRLRFLTRAGRIYGVAKRYNAGQTDCPGPLLTGIFPPKTTFRKRQDQTLAVGHSEQVAVEEAIELFLMLGPMDVPVSQIRFERVRGFFVHATFAEDVQTVVALGRAPFTSKLAKLRDIRANLQKNGDVAERIELDYQGKAFIKLRKM